MTCRRPVSVLTATSLRYKYSETDRNVAGELDYKAGTVYRHIVSSCALRYHNHGAERAGLACDDDIACRLIHYGILHHRRGDERNDRVHSVKYLRQVRNPLIRPPKMLVEGKIRAPFSLALPVRAFTYGFPRPRPDRPYRFRRPGSVTSRITS
jgi:hypothetical protein